MTVNDKTAARVAKSSGRRQPAKAGARSEQSAARREAILSAALDEFSARGFAATRLEDIAKRAGVAKGTIYLHFADKETLFQEIVRTMVVPFIASVEAMPPVDLPLRAILDRLVDLVVGEIYSTRRREIVKLVITEVPRFPALADFYYHTVIERALAAIRAPIRRAIERGELADDTLLKFPQLVVAPFVFAIVWNGLFERHAPLDVTALLRAHLDVVVGKGKMS